MTGDNLDINKNAEWANMPDRMENVQGDSVPVFIGHTRYAALLLPHILNKLRNREGNTVISIFGGSGCGKTGTAAALGWALRANEIETYIVSGDHFPKRIPLYNDAERLSRFRRAGLQALVLQNLYTQPIQKILVGLWEQDRDADENMISAYSWLAVYQEAGKEALTQYLGTPEEQDYAAANRMLSDFHESRPLWVPCMGRAADSYRYAQIAPCGNAVCILEWTHGGSRFLSGVDYSVYLDSTPESTRLARRVRGRDDKTDSPFTMMVLEIEQKAISDRIPYATWILRHGEVTEA